MSSLLSLHEEVNEALKRTGHYDLCIRATEWNIISQLCTLLETFESLTDVASGNFVGLSAVQLAYSCEGEVRLRSPLAKSARRIATKSSSSN